MSENKKREKIINIERNKEKPKTIKREGGKKDRGKREKEREINK